MAEALFSFDDAPSAQRAAQRVMDVLPDASVVLHGNAAPDERLPKAIDEAVSGGLLSNMYQLVEGIFDWQASPHGAGDYQEIIDKGGGVVRVNVGTPESEQRVDEVMREAGCAKRTSWKAQ